MTTRLPVAINLAVGALPVDDDMLVTGSKSIGELLDIDVMASLSDILLTDSRQDNGAQSSDEVTQAALAKRDDEAMTH